MTPLPPFPLQSCHGKGASDSEGAVVKTALRLAEFLYGEYFGDTKAAYNWLLANRVIDDDSADDEAARAQKKRHTISSRRFHYIDYGEVDHEALPELSGDVDGLKSCFYFDGVLGARKQATTLLYGELSCFCAPCLAGELVTSQSTLNCDADPSVYSVTETSLIKETTRTGHGSDITALTKERKERAKQLLANGRNEAAKGRDWVMVFIPDLYGGREAEKGGYMAPVQLWGAVSRGCPPLPQRATRLPPSTTLHHRQPPSTTGHRPLPPPHLPTTPHHSSRARTSRTRRW